MTTPHDNREDDPKQARKRLAMISEVHSDACEMALKMAAIDQITGVAFVMVSCETALGCRRCVAQPASYPGFTDDNDRVSGIRRFDASA
jgi:hypothetical protein